MRINKKFVEDRTGRDKLFKKDYYSDEYFVNVSNIGGFILSILGIIALLALVISMALGFYTFVTPSKYEINLYKERCDTIAGKNAHYVTRAKQYSNSYQCIIGPDFDKKVDM